MFVKVELTQKEWEQIQAQRLSVGFAEALADEMSEEMLAESDALMIDQFLSQVIKEDADEAALEVILDEDYLK